MNIHKQAAKAFVDRRPETFDDVFRSVNIIWIHCSAYEELVKITGHEVPLMTGNNYNSGS